MYNMYSLRVLPADADHSNRPTWAPFLFALLILPAVFFLPSFARNQERPPQPLKQDEACLTCHGQAGMKSEKGAEISIRPEKHAASVHGILGCKDCHASIKGFP